MSRPHLLNIINYQLFILKNKKYLQTIDQLISLDEFKNIKIKYLDKSIKSNYNNEIFCINNDSTISYLHHQNLIKFEFHKKQLTTKLRVILNINIKNQQSYELIETIIKLQSKFIKSNNKQDLKYISHNDILSQHQKNFMGKLVSSNISTISHNSFFRNHNNNIFKLNYLIPKRHYIIYIKCRYILNQYKNVSDVELSSILKEQYDITISKTKIFDMRKRYYIPAKKYRSSDIYLEYVKNYTMAYALNIESLKIFREVSAVYELSSLEIQRYSYKDCFTLYIGSTNNIKRRLTQYASGFAHTLKIRDFIKGKIIYFRFIQTIIYKELEKDILDAFFTTCGEYPLLNTNRIL